MDPVKQEIPESVPKALNDALVLLWNLVFSYADSDEPTEAMRDQAYAADYAVRAAILAYGAAQRQAGERDAIGKAADVAARCVAERKRMWDALEPERRVEAAIWALNGKLTEAKRIEEAIRALLPAQNQEAP